MWQWLAQNLGTILVGMALLGIVAAIIVSMVRKKKSGKCIGCDSCNKCSGCNINNSFIGS